MTREREISPSGRLRFDRFQENDVQDLAGLLADPDITRHITANGSTPERCLASARKRIAWHNAYWESQGYGVWALRARDKALVPENELVGWCGFAPPDGDEDDPEILYGLSRDFRKKGLATEAARHAVRWLFANTTCGGVSAVIFSRLNPGSVEVVKKLGMIYRGKMDFDTFLPDAALALDVLEYEIWRLGAGPGDLQALVQQAAFRAGQLVDVSGSVPAQIETALTDALTKRCSALALDKDRYLPAMVWQFQQGMRETTMECYNLSRDDWFENQTMA